MESTVVQPPYKIGLLPPVPAGMTRRTMSMQNPKRSSPFILSVLADKNIHNNTSTTSQDSKSDYKDSWFDRLAINHLSNSLQDATGLRSKKSGYDGLVEGASMASQRFTPTEQRKLVIQTLDNAFPKPIMSVIKTLLPPSKFAREYFAVFTTIFFPWLVGPCEVRESKIDGKTERNVVYIPKCRFLEETNCIGMCTNLCKMPSQTFIKDSLGMPFYMVPNYDDMSCEMRFGEEPPPQSADPAFSQPCYKQCKSIRRNQRICTN